MRTCPYIRGITGVTRGMSCLNQLIRCSCFWDPLHVFTCVWHIVHVLNRAQSIQNVFWLCIFLFCLSWMWNWLHVMILWTIPSEEWLHSSPDAVTLLSFAPFSRTCSSSRFISLMLWCGTHTLCRPNFRSQGNNISIQTRCLLPFHICLRAPSSYHPHPMTNWISKLALTCFVFVSFLWRDGFRMYYNSAVFVYFIYRLFSVLIPRHHALISSRTVNHMNMSGIKTCLNTSCMSNECSTLTMIDQTVPTYALQCRFVACVSVYEVVLFKSLSMMYIVYRCIYIYMVCAFLAHSSVRSRRTHSVLIFCYLLKT